MNMQDCKYYAKCSCNKCPLDPNKDNCEISDLDKHRFCRLERDRSVESSSITETKTQDVI